MKPVGLFLAAASILFARAPFSPPDFRELRTSSDPRIRPDGRLIVWVESRREDAALSSNLWIGTADGRESHAFTAGSWRDSSPRWSPDGTRVAWLSARAGNTRLHIRTVDAAGADVELPSGAETPLAFGWSPEGTAIAYTALVSARSPHAWASPEILRYLDRPAPAPAVFVVQLSGGPPRRISGEIPGCRGEPAWLLDGRSLVAACDPGIYRFPLEGGTPKLLTKDAGTYDAPLLSPDGGRIAYVMTARKPQSYTVRKLYVMNVDGSRGKILSGSLDRDASHPQWSSESRTVYFIAEDRGATHVYAARNDGTVRQVTTRAERLCGFSLADNGRAVSIRSTLSASGDVFSFTVDVVSEPVTVHSSNQHLLAGHDISVAEELTWTSAGYTVQGWLVKPPAFDAGRKYPLLVDVADDPRRMYGPEFELRTQVLAAAGLVVLCPNPRGTPGYGEEFGNLLRSRYPGDDFDDVMRGVDAAIAKGYVDPQRVHIAGGLLAAWAVGHTSRFRSAVARRPIVDWTTDVALTPDGARRAADWMGGMPWEDPDQYVKHSPIYSAGNFKTPVLILAAEHDPEADEFAFALRQRKVETAVARIPAGDNVLEVESILAWLSR